MKLGGKAKYLCHAKTEKDFVEAAIFAKNNNLKIITIGHGTNIIFTDLGFNGLVVVNEYSGYTVNNEQVIAKSGSSWDSIVKASVDNNLIGIEALSLVPGTVGGAPVNNIGAYGQEIKDTLLFVKVLNNDICKVEKIYKDACEFSYRNSIFKEKEHGKYQILEVTLGLKKYNPANYAPPNYPAVQQELKDEKLITPAIVREKIISIRQAKLPNPKQEPNTGSFFKNPVVEQKQFDDFIKKYPEAPFYELKGGSYKIPAGWLIDNLSLKGQVLNGIEVYSKQALVLVNRSASSFKQLQATINYIQTAVEAKYGIKISVEPEIIYND